MEHEQARLSGAAATALQEAWRARAARRAERREAEEAAATTLQAAMRGAWGRAEAAQRVDEATRALEAAHLREEAAAMRRAGAAHEEAMREAKARAPPLARVLHAAGVRNGGEALPVSCFWWDGPTTNGVLQPSKSVGGQQRELWWES